MSPPAAGLARWSPATRETRDTLFMLAVIAWTVAPHLLHLAPWVGVLSAVVLLWRARLAWLQRPLPGRSAVIAVLLLAAGLTWWSERTLLGRDAGLTLLVVLMSLKTLELRARRDALVVFFLGFFLVLTHFLHSQSLWTALSMTVSVWAWLTALTLAHMPAGRPPLAEAARLAGRAAVLGLPVMLVLFLLFPRIGPLWALPGDTARTGLSDQLRLGDVAELASDDSVALRLRFDGALPPREALYVRGPVLTHYDGERWTATPEPQRPAPAARPTGAATGPVWTYTLTLEPLRLPWLPLLETALLAPEVTPPLAGLPPGPDVDGQWRLRSPLAQRVRLLARAWPEARLEPDMPTWRQRDMVALPAGRHPRTLAWAVALRQRPDLRDADAGRLAAAVLAHVRQAPFVYTLSPGVYGEGGVDTLDEFWLDRRSGFCEHYAAAFVVVLRAMDVPARIVTGYQGADPQLQDGHLVVRQSHAHAWAEYWQPGLGWVRADPTAAVAPERVLQGRQLQGPPGLVMGALDAVHPDLRQALRQWLERLDNRWNQWVLGYGKQQQFDLLKGLGWPLPDTATLVRALVLLVAAAGLAGALWAWWDGRRQPPWQKLQARIRQALQPLGLAVPAHEDPGRTAQRLLAHRGEAMRPLADALLDLQALRYGRDAGRRGLDTTAWWRKFRQALAQARAGGRRAG